MNICWTKEMEKQKQLDLRNLSLENSNETNIEYCKHKKIVTRNWVHEIDRLSGITAVHIN